MDIFTTTTLPMPAPDLPVDMYSPMSSSQWLTPLSLTSSFNACQQPPSPLQLSSPCTPSGSNSLSSGFASTPGSYPVDPFYSQPLQDNYQHLYDDYHSIPYQSTSPFFNYGLSPEANMKRFLTEFSNCLKQTADKDFKASQEIWEHFVYEFFDDSVLFTIEIMGSSERYVLKREHIAGYFHTFTEAGMVNLQYALGEGHMTTHEDLFRMDYSNAACLMDCMKPNLVKVVSEGRLLIDMKAEDNLKMTFWYYKINKNNEFILRDTLHTKDEQNLSSDTSSYSGLPPEANAYLKKHGQCKVDCLDELLLSPPACTPTFVTPSTNTNWLLGTDPFMAFNGTCTTKMSSLPPFPSYHCQTSSGDHFMPPKNPIKSRYSSWSTPFSKQPCDGKFKKQHKSSGPKRKKHHRPAPIIMYITGDPLSLHRDGRLLKGISDAQEKKITCIKNTFETLRSDPDPKRNNTTSKNTSVARISKPVLKPNTALSKPVTSYQNTILSSSSSSWTDTLRLLSSSEIKLDQRQLCA